MVYFYAFLIGGFICALAELIKDMFKLTTGHMTVLFVCLGTLLDSFDFYDRLTKLAGAGAMLPITSFGHSLVHASLEKANEIGYLGIFTGVYGKTAGGIAFTMLISVLFALVFRPKK